MILDFVNGNWAAIRLKMIVISITWAAVLVAVAIDLRSGIKKSKSLGEYTHIYGLRQTIQKVVYYLTFMTFMGLFDIINPLGLMHQNFNILPLASVFGAIVLVWIEFKSVREKANMKYRRRTAKAAKELLDIALKDDGVIQKIRDSFENADTSIEE